MKVLSAEGLIKLMPNRGAVVTTITRPDVEDLCQVMGALEALGGDLACQRASDEDIAEIVDMNRRMRAFHAAEDLANYFELNQQIHQKIIDSAGNLVLSDSYRRICVRVRRARYMANFSRARWNQAMAEHELITEALMKRDSDRLKSLLSMHLANKSKVVQDWLAENETLQQKATA
jgi:DNA-binding GntR family transcriptional regulator